MPQTFIVVRCVECQKYQAKLQSKANKLQCAVCGTKQSIQRIYAISHNARDCRDRVQELSMGMAQAEETKEAHALARMEQLEEAYAAAEEGEGLMPGGACYPDSIAGQGSRWVEFAAEAEQAEEVVDACEEEDPQFVTCFDVAPSRGRGRGGRGKSNDGELEEAGQTSRAGSQGRGRKRGREAREQPIKQAFGDSPPNWPLGQRQQPSFDAALFTKQQQPCKPFSSMHQPSQQQPSHAGFSKQQPSRVDPPLQSALSIPEPGYQQPPRSNLSMQEPCYPLSNLSVQQPRQRQPCNPVAHPPPKLPASMQQPSISLHPPRFTLPPPLHTTSSSTLHPSNFGAHPPPHPTLSSHHTPASNPSTQQYGCQQQGQVQVRTACRDASNSVNCTAGLHGAQQQQQGPGWGVTKNKGGVYQGTGALGAGHQQQGVLRQPGWVKGTSAAGQENDVSKVDGWQQPQQQQQHSWAQGTTQRANVASSRSAACSDLPPQGLAASRLAEICRGATDTGSEGIVVGTAAPRKSGAVIGESRSPGRASGSKWGDFINEEEVEGDGGLDGEDDEGGFVTAL